MQDQRLTASRAAETSEQGTFPFDVTNKNPALRRGHGTMFAVLGRCCRPPDSEVPVPRGADPRVLADSPAVSPVFSGRTRPAHSLVPSTSRRDFLARDSPGSASIPYWLWKIQRPCQLATPFFKTVTWRWLPRNKPVGYGKSVRFSDTKSVQPPPWGARSRAARRRQSPVRATFRRRALRRRPAEAPHDRPPIPHADPQARAGA